MALLFLIEHAGQCAHERQFYKSIRSEMLRNLLRKINKRFGEKGNAVMTTHAMNETEGLHHQVKQRKKEIVEFIKTLEKL